MLLKSPEFSVPSSRVLAEKSVNINQRISNIDMMKICRSWVWELDIDWTILSGNTFCINHITCTCVFLVSGNGFQTDNSSVEIYRSLNAEDSMLARAICTVSLEWVDWTGSREQNGSALRDFGANSISIQFFRNRCAKDMQFAQFLSNKSWKRWGIQSSLMLPPCLSFCRPLCGGTLAWGRP